MRSTTASPGSARDAPSARRVDGPRRELKIAIDREDRHWAGSLVRMHPAGFQPTYPGRWVNNVGPGDAFSTAVACMILQIPRQYLPIFQR